MQSSLTLTPVKLLSAIVAGSIMLSACGSKSNSQQGQSPKPANQTPATNTQTSNGVGLPVLAAANTNILLTAQTPQSLVSIVKNSGKQVGVFEFVGVTCEACKTESPAIALQLAPYANNVTRVAVFPNAANQYTAAEYQNFINLYSQGARYAVDNDLTLLKSIRADNSQYFGLFVVVKSDGTGVVLNQTDALNRVVPAVKTALGQ